MVAGATGLFPFGFLCAAALFFLLLAGLFFRTGVSTPLMFGCAALVAACRFVAVSAPLSTDGIEQLLPRLPLSSMQIVGCVAGAPEFRVYGSGDRGSWTDRLVP